MRVILRVTAPQFVAGVEFDGQRMRRVAPILRWMRPFSRAQFETYCDLHGWKIEELSPLESTRDGRRDLFN